MKETGEARSIFGIGAHERHCGSFIKDTILEREGIIVDNTYET